MKWIVSLKNTNLLKTAVDSRMNKKPSENLINTHTHTQHCLPHQHTHVHAHTHREILCPPFPSPHTHTPLSSLRAHARTHTRTLFSASPLPGSEFVGEVKRNHVCHQSKPAPASVSSSEAEIMRLCSLHFLTSWPF